MYSRYLNNGDYAGLLSDSMFEQLTRDNEGAILAAEEAAEISLVEYLSEGYDIEGVLLAGKRVFPYNKQITYPSGACFYYGDKIVKATKTINGCKRPSLKVYWEEYTDLAPADTAEYSQLQSYSPKDLAVFGGVTYECQEYNGVDFGDIRVPGITGWEVVECNAWQPNFEYEAWDVVAYQGRFFALINAKAEDSTVNPEASDDWGLIGQYSEEYDEYEFTFYEYVVYEGTVFAPTMNVNADKVYVGTNAKADDPRHPNVKKHLLRLSVYELHKLISPNNVSNVRVSDYEASIQWLRDAARMRINPQLPRRLDDNDKPVCDWAIQTFARSYDPHENPWFV